MFGMLTISIIHLHPPNSNSIANRPSNKTKSNPHIAHCTSSAHQTIINLIAKPQVATTTKYHLFTFINVYALTQWRNEDDDDVQHALSNVWSMCDRTRCCRRYNNVSVPGSVWRGPSTMSGNGRNRFINVGASSATTEMCWDNSSRPIHRLLIIAITTPPQCHTPQEQLPLPQLSQSTINY